MFSKLFAAGLDQVGVFNPQLMREWQGRLRLRNVLLAIIPSLLGQALIVLQRVSQLPLDAPSQNRYCAGVQTTDYYAIRRGCTDALSSDVGIPSIHWPMFWSDIFRDMSVVLPWALIVGGVFVLIADLSKENRRGTLNFLRMSPEPSRKLLLGKLLGVPILLYLAILAALPLHASAALMGGFSLLDVGQFYLLLATITFCFYALALWFASLTPKLQGAGSWLGALLALLVILLGLVAGNDGGLIDWAGLLNPINGLAYFDVSHLGITKNYWPFTGHNVAHLAWFGMELGGVGFLSLAIAHALGLGLWLWHLLERRFEAPTLTPISKWQSYGLTTCLSVLWLGFCLDTYTEHHLGGFVYVMAFWSLLLTFLLLPSQQSMLDWARYRRQSQRSCADAEQQGRNAQVSVVGESRSQSLRWDLLNNDSSPPVLAIAINLAIVVTIMTSVLLFFSYSDAVMVICTWVLSAAFIFSCMVLIQLLALSNHSHWPWIAVGSLGAVTIGLPVSLAMLGVSEYTALPWLLTLVPQVSIQVASGAEVMIALVVHGAIASTLSLVLTRRLRFLGQSEWKALQRTTAPTLPVAP